jgi:Flp pilus assembly pilin Flp
MTLLGSVLRDEPGATAIECGLIAAGIVSRQQRSPQLFAFL